MKSSYILLIIIVLLWTIVWFWLYQSHKLGFFDQDKILKEDSRLYSIQKSRYGIEETLSRMIGGNNLNKDMTISIGKTNILEIKIHRESGVLVTIFEHKWIYEDFSRVLEIHNQKQRYNLHSIIHFYTLFPDSSWSKRYQTVCDTTSIPSKLSIRCRLEYFETMTSQAVLLKNWFFTFPLEHK